MVTSREHRSAISVMLAVADARAAVAWYKQALGATQLWSLGSVAGMEIAGAPFFVGEPARNGWEIPEKLGATSTRVEVFCDDPDALIARALAAMSSIAIHGFLPLYVLFSSRGMKKEHTNYQTSAASFGA